jgi:cytochrome c oxidase subunit 3
MNNNNEPVTDATAVGSRPPLPNPRRIGTFGMMLFLASLTMLFAASMLGYAAIRLQWLNPDRGPNPPLGSIQLPLILWFSTFVIVLSSAALHYAGHCVALERQRQFRRAMAVTAALAGLFLIVQGPALVELVRSQQGIAQDDVRLYALIVCLVILHALHVIGGLIPLGLITVNAFKGKYDHEHHHPVVHFAMYWHFLDVVWIVMFSVLQFLG